MDPLDPLPLVLLLFLFEDQLNEELLELLIAIINAQLLKGIIIKYLKPVNIKDTDDSAVVLPSYIDAKFGINVTDYPCEETIVHSLEQNNNTNLIHNYNIDEQLLPLLFNFCMFLILRFTCELATINN